MTIHNAMIDIYSRLKALGIPRVFVTDRILPDWWEDKLASVPANRSFAEIVLSRQLGLDLETIRDPKGVLQLRSELLVRFKKRATVKDGELDVAQALGSRLATLGALCIDKPFQPSVLTAKQIRQRILDKGSLWVGLDEILDFCWDCGIPVIQLCPLKGIGKKMDGMACWQEGHPVIIIPCQRKYTGWHAFILAHELGHIMCRHIFPEGAYVLDEEVRADEQQIQDNENEANAFAMELLTGSGKMTASSTSHLTGRDLAQQALLRSRERKIDPGVIILNYGWHNNRFPVAMAALNELPQQSDAASRYSARYRHLDLEMLPDDSQRVFESLTTRGD
jgi:hypothetical protein